MQSNIHDYRSIKQHEAYMWYRNLISVEMDRFLSAPTEQGIELVHKALETYLRGARAKAFTPPNFAPPKD